MLKKLVLTLGKAAAMDCDAVSDVLYPYGEDVPAEFTVILKDGQSVTVKFVMNPQLT